MQYLLLAVAGYLAGSIPFGWLLGWWVKGVDIREHGSGNIGATNAGRILGKKWGFLALSLDVLKGVLPVWLVPGLCIGEATSGDTAHVLVGIATIVGHVFPCWLGFRGGKGVATALGVAGMLSPLAAAAALGVFLLALAASRMVSVGSVLAATSYAVWHFAVSPLIKQTDGGPWSQSTAALSIFSLAIPALIVIRHRGNMRRVWDGTEAKWGQKATEPASDDGQG